MGQETTIWGIHAGRTGDAESLFLKRNVIAIGWDKVGDLNAIAGDREAFKAKVAEAYPGKKPGAIPNNAGQLYRFVHEMAAGDLVIYPSRLDRRLHVGRVEGDYRYDPSSEPGYSRYKGLLPLKKVYVPEPLEDTEG
jgi:restriction system protein